MDKIYLLIGSNNFWYSTETSYRNAVKTAKYMRENNFEGFGDPESHYEPDAPDELYIYEAELKKTFTLNKDA